VLFRDASTLAALYPALVRHAMLHSHSPDMMRFLGRKGLHAGFQGELNSRLIRRLEGTRVKHWVQGNSVKMYDKAGNCLRVETTIAKTKAFKVLRPLKANPDQRWPGAHCAPGSRTSTAVRKSPNKPTIITLTLWPRSTTTPPLHLLFDRVSRPLSYHGHRVRAVHQRP